MMSSFAPNIYFLYVSYGIVVGKKHLSLHFETILSLGL